MTRPSLEERDAGEVIRPWPAMGKVEKLDRMKHRDRCAARDLGDAADVAGGDEIGRDLRDVGNFGSLFSRPLSLRRGFSRAGRAH
jgi:hypothetical protein